MIWNGYIKGDGTCLLTPLFPEHADVIKWFGGRGMKMVCDYAGGMDGTKAMAEEHGGKHFVLHNPPDVRMTRI